MSGKRIEAILLLSVSIMMSACSVAYSPLPIGEGPLDIPNVSEPETQAPVVKPQNLVEYKQKSENLPDIKTLTSFPGLLESMSLTLEQIITVLGTQFDLQENKAQGFDTYLFPQYNLAFDFDRVNKKITTIWLDQNAYYVYSGAFQVQDLNGDGSQEKIITYEDKQYKGHLLVIDGKTSAFSDSRLDFFGGKSKFEVLSNYGESKENLILVTTLGGKGGDVFRWNDGKLANILPEDYKKLSEETLVTVEGNKAVLVNQNKNIIYVCPLPERIVKNISGRTDAGVHRFSIRLQSEKSGDSVILKVRTSLQLLLSNNYNFIDGTDGTFADVAEVIQEYKYLGQGKWQEQKAKGGPKYENAPVVNIVPEDLAIGGLTLYDDNKSIQAKFSSYKSSESESAVFKEDGLSVGITDGQITYLSLDDKSDKSTSKGLKLSDSKEKVISFYGLPDKGFKEDPIWTYYVLSQEKSKGNSQVMVNTLNIEFDNEKVCRIWISTYVTAY